MSLEKILIIKQNRETNISGCKKGLEASPEKYSVTIANSYKEGFNLLQDRSITGPERLSLVIVDAEEVDSFAIDLLTSLRGMSYYKELKVFLPVIVMTNLASDETRKMLSSMSTECIIKTGKYDKFLWNLVKNSLQRNPGRSSRPHLKRHRVFNVYPMAKKKV
jgi:hypothetical protein